ncbi:hypothetical protein DOTSEDRAFT_179215 [Dothistroma septosporum NZE10]|uniref:ubiquitinyl hydrolase 1 n=1 Tax=Dothistroma septosporum (strain NZE10 / CBS 128990) TaxID=675120 RepID=N1PG21_DOTSN|nr:hypothetical protein DOTSEDRAFT_179215 [Dothistroma septosporum NZE10]
MPAACSGPGKTAPKLFQDFLVFDPLKGHPTVNYLTDFSPPVGDGVQIAPVIGSCKHEYRIKIEQSVLPPLDLRPDGSTEYKSAVVCKKCRIHADVHIAFAHASNACPNSNHPLHHFQRTPADDSQTPGRIVYGWQCSSPVCGAQLRLAFRLSRINKEERDLLTNTEHLKRRYDAVLAKTPGRDNVTQATPNDALWRLRRYITDCLDPAQTRRELRANNKKFQEAFGVYGQDASELLQRLGFAFTPGSDKVEPMWQLPNAPSLDNRLRADGSSTRELLEDWEAELLALMYEQSSTTNAINPAAATGWPSADKDIERVLSVQGYTRHPAARRAAASNDQVAYYSSLGVLPDFADSIVEWAYGRQSLCDPERKAYYFECLQVISESRGSETLQTKVAIMQSQGEVSRRDLSAALRLLGLPANDVEGADDDRVLNLFHVRQQDSGPATQEENRQALYKIGMHRSSQVLINASRQAMETYKDALMWLGHGCNSSTTDDNLLAIAGAKIADSKDNEEMAQKAISVIAQERKSEQLNQWCLTGQSGGYEMSPDEALRVLGQDVNFASIDQAVLPTIFIAAREDRPGEQTEKAVAVLEKAAEGQAKSSSAWDATSSPVGLISHGNTCYLNSILQYYFSIKRLRDVVLNYDEYRLDTERNPAKVEHVGQRAISLVEIKGGQRFAEDLRELFKRMISSPERAVRPETDLVCRAFLPPEEFATIAKADSEATQKSAYELVNAVDESMSDESAAAMSDAINARHQSDASSVTLQGDKPPTPPASPISKAHAEENTPVDPPPLPPRRMSSVKQDALKKAEENARQQQDVTEVHDNIMWRLRAGMKAEGTDQEKEQDDELRDLFKIKVLDTTVAHGKDVSRKEQNDSWLRTNVAHEDTDIYSALDEVFDLQPISNEKADNTKDRYYSLHSLPPLMQISIPRNDWNKKRQTSEKTDKQVVLHEELYFDRYTSNDPQIMERRRLCWQWRRRLQTLKKERRAILETDSDLDGLKNMQETAKYLHSLSELRSELHDVGMKRVIVDSDLTATISNTASELSERLEQMETEMKEMESNLKGKFDEFKDIKYELAAAFVHRGNHAGGHYWICIRDFESGKWRKYNDETVEEFTSIGDILAPTQYAQGTPTFAMYVRAGEGKEYVQPLCRNVEQPQSAFDWEDVTMANTESQAPAKALNSIIDPRLTTKESEASWDAEREVTGVQW